MAEILHVLLPDDIASEIVQAYAHPDGAKIAQIPAFNGRVNIGDVVAVQEIEGVKVAAEVLSSAGWSNIGLHIADEHKDEATRVLAEIEGYGCIIESRKPIQINIGVPASAFADVVQEVEAGIARGLWTGSIIYNAAA